MFVGMDSGEKERKRKRIWGRERGRRGRSPSRGRERRSQEIGMKKRV